MAEPIAGAFAKLERAQEHLTLLQRELLDFEERNTEYVLAEEVHSESGRKVLRAQHIPQAPSHLGLVFSDVVHNLRSALDYAVYRPTRTGQTQTAFPIYLVGKSKDKKKRTYAKVGIKLIEHLPAPAQKFIEFVQPYHRRSGRSQALLWRLQDLARAEKHHGVPFITRLGERRGSEIYASGGQEIPERVDGGPMYFDEGGIAAVLWSPLYPEIRLKPRFVLKVFLPVRRQSWDWELGALASGMYNHVTWILVSLKGML